MQKRFLAVLLVVAMGFILTACDADSKKIGVINEEKVYAESNATKAATKQLDDFSATLQPELAKIQAKLDRDPDNKALQEETNKRFYDLQQQFGVEQQRVVNKVNDLYTSTREKCRKEAKMDLILSSEVALSYDNSVDITDRVIAEMNKTTLDFSASDAKTEEIASMPKGGNATSMTNATSIKKETADEKTTKKK